MDVARLALLIPLFGIFFGCIIVIFAIIFENNQKRKYYESLVKAMEVSKNPEQIKELFGAPRKKEADTTKYLKNGIITIGIAIGICIFALVVKTVELVGIAGFLCVLGLSFLVVHLLIDKRKKAE